MRDYGRFKLERDDAKAPGVLVYRLKGLLTNAPETYAFLEELRERLREESPRAVLNLAGVERITSGGVGIIAACFTSAVNAGGRLVLAAVPKSVETVLNIVCLLNVVEGHATEDAAIAAVSAKPA
jgi:anti-anti-sigma factor